SLYHRLACSCIWRWRTLGNDDFGCGSGVSDGVGNILAVGYGDRRLALRDGGSIGSSMRWCPFCGRRGHRGGARKRILLSLFPGVSAIFTGNGLSALLSFA